MTTPPSKETQFKQHFVALMADLQANGTSDRQAMALLGNLAGQIATQLGQPSWSAAKTVLTAEAYDELLNAFQRQGNEQHKAGNTEKAYAIQALATSLVAMTQRTDPTIAEGEVLLDSLIDGAVGAFGQPVRH